MGGKKGGKGKKGKKGKKGQEDEDPMDELHEMDGQTLEKLRSTNKEKLKDAQLYRNLLQMEKDMIHDFYHNTRSEIRELEARVKNFDTDMQTKEEGHRTELKVFMQKVRHLEYDHGNSQENVKANADTIMLEEQKQHTEREIEMMKMKKKERDDYNKSEQQAHNEIDVSKKEGESMLNSKQKALDGLREQLIDQYDD
jgi:growth arrest-specific protein 8